jgi:zinc protease
VTDAVRTEIDGVPAIVGDVPGRAKAALVFRAGQSDETLATRGLTHLVEHLALGDEVRTNVAAGYVDQTATVAIVEGSPAEVAQRLETIAQRFGALPLDRLDVERRVLLAEGDTPPHPAHELFTWHFGARGPGLVAKPELGLRRVSTDDVAAHAATWFTKDNAGLALSQPLPELRRLAPPDGERRQVGQHPRVRRWPLPCEVEHEGTRYTGLGAPVAGDAEVPVLRALLERLAWRILRHELGLAYHVDCRAEPIQSGLRFVNISTDALAADAGRATAFMFDAIRAIARGDVSDDDLTGAKGDILRGMADEPVALLIGVVRVELGSGRRRSPAELIEKLQAVTAEDVARAAASMRDALIATLPTGQRSGVLPRLIGGDMRLIDGRRMSLTQEAEHAELRIGGDGVTAIDRDGRVATVLFSECVAAVHAADAALVLIGPDDAHVVINPAHTPDGSAVLAQVLASVDPRVVIPAPDGTAPATKSRPTTATGNSTTSGHVTFKRGT